MPSEVISTTQQLDAKAMKKLTKKLGHEPTEAEVAKFLKKQAKKAGAETAAAPEESKKKEKKSKKEKKEKKSKKEKKEKRSKTDETEEKETETVEPAAKAAKVVEEEPATAEEESEPAVAATNPDVDYTMTKVDNPTGSPRVFLGNCSYSIDDDAVRAHFKKCGGIADIYWLMDKETQKFYGSGFVTFEDADSAARACSLNGVEIAGRATKVEITTPRKSNNDKPKAAANSRPCIPTSEKPEGCNTLFIGNLSFQIEEDHVYEFFKDCGEISAVRWCENKETGEFKGCGFVQFADAASVDPAVKLAGTHLLGRSVRMDYA